MLRYVVKRRMSWRVVSCPVVSWHGRVAHVMSCQRVTLRISTQHGYTARVILHHAHVVMRAYQTRYAQCTHRRHVDTVSDVIMASPQACAVLAC